MTILLNPLPRRSCSTCVFWDAEYYIHVNNGIVESICAGHVKVIAGVPQTDYRNTRGSDYCSKFYRPKEQST